MIRILLSLCVFLLGGWSTVSWADQPNMILIFVDDLGWRDVACYGNDFVDTPRIDQLAAEGMRFTDFYAAGAVCSPTRCAVQSGQNQARIGGPHLPGKYRVQGRSDLGPKPGQYRTEFEADLSVDFIQRHRDQPFFLMLSPFAVHIPLGAMSAKVEKYRQRAEATGRQLPHPVYAAMIEHVDDMVGRVVDEVQSQGLSEKTMIVFTSDNGGLYRRYDYRSVADDDVTTMKPLKGEKGSLHEGGVRVPLIVKYPPLVKPSTVCAEPTISYDFYPTFVDIAGGKLPENQTIDGLSLKPLLVDSKARLDRDALHWHYPHYHHDRPASSIRERDWKLIDNDSLPPKKIRLCHKRPLALTLG